jgi:hypothetical protein
MLGFRGFLMEKYNVLKHFDLTKRGGARVDVFLQKIKDSEPFMTAKGAVVFDKNQLKSLEDSMRKSGFKTILIGTTTIDKKPVKVAYPSEFLKTPEFGGKGAGFGTQAEDAALRLFTKELDAVFVKENQPVIKLRANGRIVECAGIISTPQRGRRAPKADFSIINSKKEEVAFISHKDGTKPSQFQQYGGLSDPAFVSNKEVKKFLTDLLEIYPDGLTRGTSVKRKVGDKKIINMSVYGTNYGKKPGHENVDEFHQGNMKLKKVGSVYEIVSSHKGKNGDIPTDRGYECIYFARYTGDRGARIGDIFIPNARVGVFLAAKAPGTTKEI